MPSEVSGSDVGPVIKDKEYYKRIAGGEAPAQEEKTAAKPGESAVEKEPGAKPAEATEEKPVENDANVAKGFACCIIIVIIFIALWVFETFF